MAGSSKKAPPAAPAAKEEAPSPPVDPAPLSKEEKKQKKEKGKKTKKVILSQSYVDFVLSCEKTERTPPLDLGFMDGLLARIPGDSDEYLAKQGFTLEGMKQIAATMDDMIEKYEDEALADLDYYRIREEYERKGYVEMEITDDDEEETRAGIGAPRPPPPGRRRFRRGVTKKAGGGVNKLN